MTTQTISPITYDCPASIATGTYTGDGSTAVYVNIGFTPKFVQLLDMATSTNAKRYVWVQGMASTLTLLDNGSTDVAEDTNTIIVTDGKVTSTTEVGVYAPGTQSADGGTLTNTTVSVYGHDSTVTHKLTFGVSTSSHTYVWVAIG